jgi:hypothetical protein
MQDFKPRIHLSESDYAVFTQNGTLCDEHGNLGPQQFETALRRQMKIYTQRQLSNALILGASSRAELVQLGTLKAVLRDQAKFQEEQARIEERNQSVGNCVESMRCDVVSLRQELRELSGQLRCGHAKQEFRPVFSSQVFEVMAQAKIRPAKGADEPCIVSMTPRSFAEEGTNVIQSPRLAVSEEVLGKNDVILSAGVWPKYPGSKDCLLTSNESRNAPQLVEDSIAHAAYSPIYQLEGSECTDNSPQGMPGLYSSKIYMPNPTLNHDTCPNGKATKETEESGADDPSRVLECSVDAEHNQGSRLDALTPSSSSSSAEGYMLSRSGGSNHNNSQPGIGFTDGLPHYCEKVPALSDDFGTELRVQAAQEESVCCGSEMKELEDQSSKPTSDVGPHTNQRVGSNGYKHGLQWQPVPIVAVLHSQEINAIGDKCLRLEPNDNSGPHTNQRVHVSANGFTYGLDPTKGIGLSGNTPDLKLAGLPSIVRSAAEIKWSKREIGHSVATKSKESSSSRDYLERAAAGTISGKNLTGTVGGGQRLSTKFILEESLPSRLSEPTSQSILGKNKGEVLLYCFLFGALLCLTLSKP